MPIFARPARLLVALLCLAALLISCGYTFPHVYDGPERVVYMPGWQNRTNRLGLDNKVYQSLSRWFQKSEAIRLSKSAMGADLILTGEFLAIDLPTVTWESVSRSSSARVDLHVRYTLKNAKTGEVLWEIGKRIYSEDYLASSASPYTEDMALDKIIEDISEDIYLGTLKRIKKLQ